jgi:hypothetical protein
MDGRRLDLEFACPFVLGLAALAIDEASRQAERTELMEATKYGTIGQLTQAMFEVGGQCHS